MIVSLGNRIFQNNKYQINISQAVRCTHDINMSKTKPDLWHLIGYVSVTLLYFL